MTALSAHNDARQRAQSVRLFIAPAHGYVMVPRRLLLELSDNLVALGLYALVARLYLLTKAAVPLSEPDMVAYSGHCRGSIRKAFRRLLIAGWLLETKTAGGKSHYTPTWGRISGQPRPWQLGAGQLGKPRHIEAYRLDERLFDTCIGSLTPLANRPARIERWIEVPLISLRDVGTYLLAVDGQRVTSPALQRFKLIQAGRPQPLPSDEQLLAIAQQATLDGQAVSLTDQGYRHLGLIPPMIPSMIPNTSADEAGSTAEGSHVTAMEAQANRSTRTQRMLTQSLNPPTPQTRQALSGGHKQTNNEQIQQREGSNSPEGHELVGGDTKKHEPPARSRRQPLPETPAAALLANLNVRPICIRELASMPADLVERAIADGQARPEVEDLAGWVVSMMRDVREHGWKIAVAKRKPGSARRSANSTPTTEQIEAAIRKAKASGAFLHDGLLEAHGTNPEQCTDTRVSVQRERGSPPPPHLRAENAAAASADRQIDSPPGPHVEQSQDDEDTGERRFLDDLRDDLQARLQPAQQSLLDGLRLGLEGGYLLMLHCRDLEHRAAVEAEIQPLIEQIFRERGCSLPPRLQLLPALADYRFYAPLGSGR